MGKSTINGPFSIAMLVHQRVLWMGQRNPAVDGCEIFMIGWVSTIQAGGLSDFAGPSTVSVGLSMFTS